MKKLLMILCVLPLLTPVFSAYAEGGAPAVSGIYHYTSSHTTHFQLEDTFTWDEAWFAPSSFEVSAPLALLSSQTALASISRFGEGNDDPADDPENLIAMLRAMGFLDIETNGYYTLPRLMDSMAVAAAHREITVNGTACTLLAVIPCSGGYGQEWGGNFHVGEGSLHQGFREARDEALRFTRQYLQAHGITGDIKVWLAGHSRGGAVANLIGGFLAGGGAAYLGDVRILPENVYCYTFATPRNITADASAQDVLRVGGARGGLYEADTPGEAWSSPEDGIIEPDAPAYGGIHNFVLPYDLISALPPEDWNMTRYGVTLTQDLDGTLDADAMAQAMRALNPLLYEDLTGGGDRREYAPKTLDLPNLRMADDPLADRSAGAETLARRLADALVRLAGDRGGYGRDGMQETMAAMGGLYGIARPTFSGIRDDLKSLIRPVLLICLAYGAEQLTAEGRVPADAADSEKAALVLTDLISWITGTELDPEIDTLDDAYVALVSWFLDNEDTVLGQTAFSALASLLEGSSLSGLIESYFKPFVADADTATMEEKLRAFLHATVEGPQPGTPAFDKPDVYSAESQRSVLFTVMILGGILPWGTSGASALAEGAEVLCRKLTDGAGSLTEAADAALCGMLDLLLEPVVEDTARFGEAVHAQAAAHLETLKANAGIVRALLTRLLFAGNETSFSAEAMTRNAATFIGNVRILPLAHYNETAVSWARVWAALEADK